MKLSDFQYELPKRLIAQKPAEQRTGSRLMVVDRAGGRIIHDAFSNLHKYLNAGDCLALNDTRVMNARLFGEKISQPAGGGSRAEILLIREIGKTDWEVMARPGKRLAKGAQISLCDGRMSAEILEVLPSGHRIVRFNPIEEDFDTLISKYGQMPFPPYIKERGADPDRYQTVYAKEPGSAAAPTAGLHFTGDYLNKLTEAGIKTAYLTLHIGPGTFAPVKNENIEEHHMHSEYYHVGDQAAALINGVKKTACASENPKIVSVGTTSLRTLESVAAPDGTIRSGSGQTDIFIYPGYVFKCVDALLTNFHLPGSTLLMLICAFAGYDLAMEAYRIAVENEYRFFSFGDAMLIMDL